MLPNESQSLGLDNEWPGSEFSVQDILRMLLENLWIILAIVAAALAYSYYVIKNTPERYRATSVLAVNMDQKRVMTQIETLDNPRFGSDPLTMNFLATEIGTRLEVAEATAQNTLRRYESGELAEGDPGRALIEQWISGPGMETREAKVQAIMKRLRGASGKERRGSWFIDVSATSSDPAMAQLLANEYALGFVTYKKDSRAGTKTNAAEFLMREIPKMRSRLDTAESNLAAFLRTNPISISDSGQLSTDGGLGDRMVKLRADVVQLQTDWEQIEKVKDDPEQLLLIGSVASSPRVSSLRNQVQIQKNNIVNLEQRYRSKHPKMIEAKNFLSSLEASLRAEVLAAPKQLRVDLERLQQEVSRLGEINKQYEADLKEKNVTKLTYTRLLDTAESARKLHRDALIRLDEIRHLQEKDRDSDYQVSTFSLSGLPRKPYQPDAKRIISLYVGIGIGLSLGIIYLLHLLDTTIKSVDQAERMFGIPVLGSIPRSSDIHGDKQRLILSSDPNSLCSEAFRTLRAAIGLLGREDERRVTLFTSAVPAEGKTFCSANFALASANQGRKTLIVDFDLRRPSVGDTFGIDSDRIGVSDCLLGKSTIEEAAIVTEYENLHVMTAGTMVPNPSELISSRHTPEFIAEAKEKYDQVVLDNAPVTAVSDTLLILHYVDTVCLVSRAAKTSYRLVGRALELIRRGGVAPSGLVLNFVPQRGRTGYYYYYYSNKNYYGGYGQDRKKKSKAAY